MQIDDLYVLVVEPSKVQRRIILEKLKDAGISDITEALDGASALQAMRKAPPDLLISAFHLEDMSGAELLNNVRQDASLRDTSFILVSSETKLRYLEPVKQFGATAVLPKPFSDDQLHTALRTTIDIIDPEPVGLGEDIDLETLHVLLVDDSPMARKYIRNVLEGLGIETFSEADDGEQAIALLETEFFDLVVTDYNMPNVDGEELTEYIRQSSGQRSVPILMVTSETNQGRLSGIQQSGVSALCDKPFSSAEVRQLLTTLLTES